MNISNLLHSIKSRFAYGSYLRPARDWFVLLSVWAVLLFGVLLYNIWVFDRLASGNTLGTQIVTAPSIFNRSSLDAIQKVFSDRATEEVKYATGVYHFTDPSL